MYESIAANRVLYAFVSTLSDLLQIPTFSSCFFRLFIFALILCFHVRLLKKSPEKWFRIKFLKNSKFKMLANQWINRVTISYTNKKNKYSLVVICAVMSFRFYGIQNFFEARDGSAPSSAKFNLFSQTVLSMIENTV